MNRTQSTVTMSSKEIAVLVDSRHDSVKRAIERLVERSVILQPPLVVGIKSANGVVTSEYQISKRDSYIIVAQLSPEFTARLVDRWQELENQTSLQLPQTYSAALLEAGRLAQENEKRTLERDQAADKASDLEEKLGVAENWKQAKAIEWLADYFNLSKVAYSQIGRALSSTSRLMGLEPKAIDDSAYGYVKAYHSSVILKFKEKLDSDCNLLIKYRLADI
jgi:phage regulator Rha-like protein